MKERPMIFNGEMVRAILDGHKTQTRRLINPQPIIIVPEIAPIAWNWNDKIETYEPIFQVYMADICPYGKPCDRLWVRETWASFSQRHLRNHDSRYPIHYHLPHYPDVIVIYRESGADFPKHFYENGYAYWKPSIHMPRWASRITLEITNIRVERLQEITEADAQREGWFFQNIDPNQTYDPVTMNYARRWFMDLWNSLNAKRGYPWENNPWVWVIEFRKLEIKNNA